MLGARNTSQIDEVYTRGRHEKLEVYYISQSCFGLPKKSIRNDLDRIVLFKQTLRDVESMYKDIAFHDMRYDECEQMCRRSWIKKFNYICLVMTKNKNEGKYRSFNESKNR